MKNFASKAEPDSLTNFNLSLSSADAVSLFRLVNPEVLQTTEPGNPDPAVEPNPGSGTLGQCIIHKWVELSDKIKQAHQGAKQSRKMTMRVDMLNRMASDQRQKLIDRTVNSIPTFLQGEPIITASAIQTADGQTNFVLEWEQ